jgi:amino acid adenylation domain-containing protein
VFQLPPNNIEKLASPTDNTSVEAERFQLEDWNDTQSVFPDDACIHELFENQVLRTPDARALVFGELSIGYRKLNERANRLAHYLRRYGVGPDKLVALCAERSFEALIGVLGILKAGAAYVPLDPAYPSDRLEYILANSDAKVLLTLDGTRNRLPSSTAEIVSLDGDWDKIANESAANPVTEVGPENLAYVIYTSGSTGSPKGVAMNHRPICNLTVWQNHRSDVGAGGKTLQLTSLSFDVSVQEIFSTLCTGGVLYLISEDLRRDPKAVLRLITGEAIERIFLPFSSLQQLADTALREHMVPSSLKEIMTAGEQLRITPQIASFFERLVDCTLYNQYGPTETHVVMTSYSLEGRPGDWPELPPIGRPIANTQVYVLDDQLQPLPIGATGELYIGGDSLARGYLNQPELTAERFIPNPFSSRHGARLYRSGDLVRYLSDGNVEFVGRADEQVKVRGYRIELGEIEVALSRHSNVRQTAAVADDGADGNKRLVAYIVCDGDQIVSTSELRQFLGQRLPEYMIPSIFVFLNSLPLTPSGKVDKNSLPTPEATRPNLESKFRPPKNAIEQTLVEIWAEVLELDKVGVNDNFLDLGGDSLKATQVLARIEERLGAELSHKTSFEAPTIAEMAARIHVAPNKKGTAFQPATDSRLALPKSISLSAAQEGIWIATQLQREEPLYNESFTIHINEYVDLVALEQALNVFIERHSALRSGFVKTDSGIAQQVQKPARLQLQFIDLRSIAEGKRESEFSRRAGKEARHLFDLGQSPLMRAALFQLAQDKFRLYLVNHHIIADAYSLYEVLRPELQALYRQISNDKPVEVPPPSGQYANYVRWQSEYLAGKTVDEDRAYWERQLTGITPLELPTDRPRPSVCTFRGRFERFSLPKKLSTALAELGQRNGVTMYMLLLAAFNVMLWRYTNQEDIAVGTVKLDRHRPELESVFGLFLNTLVIRTRLEDNPRFDELLKRVRETALDAYEHYRYPFSKLVEHFQTSRDLSRHPLFQVAFVMEPALAIDTSEWLVSQLDVQDGTSKFDLTLELEAREEGIIGRFEYSTDLFERATIERMIGHFQVLLESIVENPARRLSDLPLLPVAERQKLLVEWNDTSVPFPREKCIHELFEEQVTRTPNAVAVVDEETNLSYGELNSRANQLANYLLARGAGPETFVGLYLQRSVDLVVATLGILKAGAAYVPLDPSYPAERLRFMLEDAPVSVIVTQQSLIASLPSSAADHICLDREHERISRESPQNPTRQTSPDNTAYVIYTSGSSGKPKGVMVHHRAVNRLICNTDYVSLNASDCVAQVSNISFDAASFELWGALLNGARLVVIVRESLLSAEHFAQRVREHKVNTLFLTTALFNQFARSRSEIFSDMRNVLFGGEIADPSAIARVLDINPPERLIHVYGPTEATTFATWYEVAECNDEGRSIPIGRPIRNTQIFVLDQHLNPAPVGVPGELYIGGDGVAQGYLNRPDLTAERFISNPFGDDLEKRLYKTGDRVRYLPDGNIEFLGRSDNQIKLRGFRIELGEIEALLTQHADVQEAVVRLREDNAGDKRIVAYVVMHPDTPTTENKIRAYLKTELPDFMMPSAIVRLDRLLLTANGKVDRAALPPPTKIGNPSDVVRVAPRNAVEVQMKQFWVELLGTSDFGIDDNFFDLGGHSILAVQLIDKIKQLFGRDLPLDALWYGRGTIRCLSQMLLDDSAEPIWSRPVAIKPDGEERPLFCLPVAGGHLFEYFHLSAFIDPKRPIYGLPSSGVDGKQPVHTSIEAMAAHSIKQMRQIQPVGPYLLMGYCSGGVIAYEMAVQLKARGEEVAFLGLIDSMAPSFRSTFISMLKDLVRGKDLRHIQERLYALFLNGIGLPQLRKLNHMGEAHRWALWRYRPRPLDGRITLIRPTNYEYSRDEALGWGALARGGVEVHSLPGVHGDLVKESGAEQLAEQLNNCLVAISRNQVTE